MWMDKCVCLWGGREAERKHLANRATEEWAVTVAAAAAAAAAPHGYGITKEVGTGAENGHEGVCV